MLDAAVVGVVFERTRVVNAKYQRLGEPAVTLDDIAISANSGAKRRGIPKNLWPRALDDHRSTRSGHRRQRGHGGCAEWLGSRYNKPGFDLFDYNIYAICGDGDMMEGVGSEAASLAGHLALDDLCWIYDNNHITIDGKTRITFTEDVAARFLAYHWNVLRVGDANDLESIEEALAVFRKTKDRPTLIILDSHIGDGFRTRSILQLTALGEDQAKLVKRAYQLLGKQRQVPGA